VTGVACLVSRLSSLVSGRETRGMPHLSLVSRLSSVVARICLAPLTSPLALLVCMCVGGVGRQSSQVAALRVLAQLVVHPHHELALEFVRVRGEFVLLYVLSQSPSPDQQGVNVRACRIYAESCCVRTIC